MIPSPKVATYDLQPAMSAPELTTRLIEEIKSNQYDVIICNYANPDMVGHTGNFAATVEAIEIIDACLGRVIEALKSTQGELLITADHGASRARTRAAGSCCKRSSPISTPTCD